MTSLSYDVKEKLRNLNVFEKIIGVNIFIFILGWILSLSLNLMRQDSLKWLELPKDFFEFIMKPWSILTYGFTHYDFWHLLFNLIVLYFVSRSMHNLFSNKLSLNVYFMGIISGGLLYLLVYNVTPDSFSSSVGSLVGASAGVNALLIFLCTYMPNQEARFFSIRIKLWHIGVAIVLIDLFGLFGINQGGKVAHFGGTILGYLYATQLKKGTDIGKGFEGFTDNLSKVFSKSKTSSNLKTVHRNRKKPFAGHNKNEFNEFSKQKKIDLILDKIGKSGYDSLTAEEKEFLFRAGKD